MIATTVQSEGKPRSADPIAAVGHGAMLDINGKRIDISNAFMRRAQAYYLSTLEKQASVWNLILLKRYIKTLQKIPTRFRVDDAQRDALTINWLLQRLPLKQVEPIKLKVRTLNSRYLIDVLKLDLKKYKIDYETGLPQYLLPYAGGDKMAFSRQITNASGNAYVEECRKVGVPIPPDFNAGNWDSGDWTHNGAIDPDFLASTSVADVYYHRSDSPKGSCIALPRRDGDAVSIMGIICLGQETGKACFWDKTNAGFNEPLTVSDFVGGVDLFAGTCSDCHAGENPFIVHPQSSLNIGIDALSSPSWHDPLMKPSWPQNPGPLTLLDLVPLDSDDNSCLDCHTSMYAGRFPQVGVLPNYCFSVLAPAIAQTMPPRPGGMTDAEYNVYKATFSKHNEALKAFCQQPPPDGTVVTVDKPEEDPSYLSTPVIIEPLYACAEAIEVTSVIYGAQLEVYIDGTLANTVNVVEPSRQIVKVPALVAGQELYAVQIKDGVSSDKSDSVFVSSHKEDYPDGLPKPEIDPQLIHQCGNVIAVRHVRGATVTIEVNGGDPRSSSSGGDWTNFAPKIRPFNLGDVYTAEQEMCGDVSDPSNPEVAVAPPSPMPVPALIDSPIVAGQELIGIENLAHGARTTVDVSGVGTVASFSTAVDWKPEVNIASGLGGPLIEGQTVSVVSSLCQATKIGFNSVQRCNDIPAPRIEQPFVGATSVTVTDAIAGARILVHDNNGIEIGDSSGAVIALSRAIVVGDVLTIVQKVGDCISKTGFQVTAMCLNTEQGC